MDCFRQWKQVLGMVATSFSLAIVNVLLKKILNEGMDHLLIILYRQMISSIFLAPMAYFWESVSIFDTIVHASYKVIDEKKSKYFSFKYITSKQLYISQFRRRKSRPKLTVPILCHHFVSALIGVTLTQYFFLLGLKFTSATFSCAFINMVPVITFMMALLFGLEKVNIRNKSGRAKLLGALVCVGGALLLSLYKGIPLRNLPTPREVPKTNNQLDGTKRWGTGTLLLTAGSIMWSSWFLIQAKIGKIYPCQYSSTAMISFFSAIQSVILCMAIDKNISTWIVKGKLDILSVLYAGMVGSGLCYVVMSWCVKEKGPVFTSAFSPFIQIFVAAFDITFLREQIHLGSVLGSILVIVGMYILLWGKIHEAAELCKTIKPDSGPTAEDDNGGQFQVSFVVPVTISRIST